MGGPAAITNAILGSLAALSLVLLVWQWFVARRFPLHQRAAAHSFPPAVTLLKPLKGCETGTAECLRSWFAQDYSGRVQLLFGVASSDDPACQVVHQLQKEFPGADSQLLICGPPAGANAKVSKLVELLRLAKHEILIISDADVRVPPDFLVNIVEPLRRPDCGLVNCFYRLANPSTLAMHWEAVAINADFWSQVLQSESLKPLDFALGAVMGTGRKQLEQSGGFTALLDCLADDYQLGNRIARQRYEIALSPVVVECWSSPQDWAAVWKHQLRWARTIRVCQPVPYFFSILSNATAWPLLWLLASPNFLVLSICLSFWAVRMTMAHDCQKRLTQDPSWKQPNPAPQGSGAEKSPGSLPMAPSWMVPVKDLLQVAIWVLAFAGNRIEWRGQKMRLRKDGTLVKG